MLVDISHAIGRHDIAAGAFALAQAAPLFPPGTIHVAVVNPGVGGARADVVVEAGGAFFVGPDNGLLSLAARGPRAAHVIDRPGFRREPVSPTFHGRDVFAQTAGRLASGASPRDVGTLLPAIQELAARPPGDGGEAVIVHVDAFGNLITIVDRRGPGRGRRTLLARDERGARLPLRLGETYADVACGELVAYVGSAGLVEIAVREGSAAAVTGLGRGARLWLERGGA